MNAAIRFPKALKRGPKVRTGPTAKILAFPTPLTGDALRARWAWLNDRSRHWEHEEIDGAYSEPKEWDSAVRISGVLRAHFKGEEFNDAFMRREIRDMCEHIEKRVQVKDWLESLGIDWKKCRSPESALSFVFDKLGGPTLPASA